MTLETRATVVEVGEKYTLVTAASANGCSQCNGKGCGSGKLTQLFCSKPRQFQVDNPIQARAGDEVVVSVAEGAVMRGIGLVYLLPLLLLVIGASLGNILAATAASADLYSALGAGGGLIFGFLVAKYVASRQNRQQNRPYIARRWVAEK